MRHAHGILVAVPTRRGLRFRVRALGVAALCTPVLLSCSEHGPARDLTDAGGQCVEYFPRRSSTSSEDGGPFVATGALRINEVITNNDGAWVDEQGETDDLIELVNAGTETQTFSGYSISDRAGSATKLPDFELAPGKTALVWADDAPEQGAMHVPFKLSSGGTSVFLWSNACSLADRVDVPSLPANESYARVPSGAGSFVECRYATPERDNGSRCEPPPPPNITDDVVYAPYTWTDPLPKIKGPLVLSEMALNPPVFIEVLNASSATVTLADYGLRLSTTGPGMPFPAANEGLAFDWPAGIDALAPGQRISVPVTEANIRAVRAGGRFEGVATISSTQSADAAPSDRIEFDQWASGAALARSPDANGIPRFCTVATPGKENTECTPVLSRTLDDRLRYLSTPGDFQALAEGGTEVGEAAVKFVVDMNAIGASTPADQPDAVYLLGTKQWALHYTWIREQIYDEPHLDRCDPLQSQEFNTGWAIFSQDEYFRVEGRRFLLGTLIKHLNGTKTVEFTPGDAISAEQMQRAFFAVTRHVEKPDEWMIRPTEARQVTELRKLEGKAPLIGPNGAYTGITYQPLTATVGFGTLQFIPATDLETAELGPRVIVVTDDVPNESAFMGGLITEAFQTPLAHVNVLSRARNTPNMALRGAKTDPRVQPLIGKLVRLEVRASDFDLREATAEEADAFWQSRKPTGPKLVPPRDLSVRGVTPLDSQAYGSMPSVGSKAAGIAELYRVAIAADYCPPGSVPLIVPKQAFAIPFAHYVEHFEASGARALLEELERDPAFRADPKKHVDGLAEVREKVLRYPVEPGLLKDVVAAVESRFGTKTVRLRSSSNTEDLATFNGAGLHESTSAEVDTNGASIENSLRLVWSSLWNTRAYDERDFGNIDQSAAAMGVLVHEAFHSEAAQGVGISRNALHATRSDQYYLNAQVGEASVTNPAPGVTSDEIVYTPPPRTPQADYRSRSSLTHGKDVLTFPEIRGLGCALGAIHRHFQPLVDPKNENRLFAMQIEWKLLKPDRIPLVKQARPYTFGSLEVPQDCREF
jgi:hypothetical protein